MDIRRINNIDINEVKWNQVIKEAYNSTPYGYAWYLNAVCDNWDALIINDYEVVLPLPFVTKFGFKLYTQPILSQQLGPFSKEALSENTIRLLFNNLPVSPWRLNLNLSTEITIPKTHSFLNPIKRINQVIDLDQSMEEIELKFNRSVRRNLKAGLENLGPLESLNDTKEVTEFYQNILKDKVNLDREAYKRTLNLFKVAEENNMAKFYQIRHKKSGLPVCKGAVILDDKRVINLFSTSLKTKDAKGAATLYIYLLLKKFQSEKKVFDFEGSNIPEINKFFNSFGAETTYYYSIDKMHPLLKLVYKAKVYLRTRKIKG
ncbi:MAG: hypothetical protein P8P48_05190 [Saprospiraceae bacterium]|nr:hypothetical protein [Saprospiraceae bacterium]